MIDIIARRRAAKALAQSGVNSAAGIYNNDPQLLPKWRRALGRVRSGTGRARILCIGDSTTFGTGAGSGAAGRVGAKPYSYPAQLAKVLTSRGIPAINESWFGDGSVATFSELATYNTALVTPAGWAASGITSLGASMLRNNTTTNALTFTPTIQTDTLEHFYAKASSGGTFTLNANGGAALATIDSTLSAPGAGKQSVSAALAANVWGAARTTGGFAYIIGQIAYNSAVPAVDILNAGWGGSLLVNWADTTNPWSPQNAIALVTPDLTIIDLTVNDWNAPTSLATYTTQLQALVTTALASGDVILMSGIPSNPSTNASVAQQATYIAAAKAVALANGCPFISLTDRFKSYATANALGLMYDNLHGNAVAYADQAQLVGKLLSGV